MMRMRLVLVVTVLVAIGAAAAGLAGAVVAKQAARAQKVERGRYLTVIAGCNDCHTPGFFYGAPDFARQLSGSELGWVGPWGVSFPRNLTPDPETGIGRWTEQQIVNTIRTGVRPDGTVLLPPMPWPNYASLSDADAYAIAAYLKSLTPVKHTAPRQVSPGVAFEGPALRFPAPPAWDAPAPATSANAGEQSR